MTLIFTHFFWLSIAASALNSAVLATIAGFAAKAESGSLIVLILILTVASHLISFCYFIAGRFLHRIAVKLKHKHHLHIRSQHLQQVNRYIQKYRLVFIILYRFLPGIRFISPYIIGMNASSFWRFFLVDWIGAFIWAVIFGILGYLFGAAAEHYMATFSDYAKYIYITAAIIAVVLIGKNRLHKFIKQRREK